MGIKNGLNLLILFVQIAKRQDIVSLMVEILFDRLQMVVILLLDISQLHLSLIHI